MLYYDPSVSNAAETRQCLAYFFNAFSCSTQENQFNISLIFLKSMLALDAMNIENGSEIISLPKVASQLLEWTDERMLLRWINSNM
jgi:Nuclear condensing complex subunits, C-term domain